MKQRDTNATTPPEALCSPSVTYVGLPATAASEDVELMGRVIAQDLKQHSSKRIDALRRGAAVTTALLVFDEFAALKEAEQIVDLLLQAREAQMPTVISTQYIPDGTVSVVSTATNKATATLTSAQVGSNPSAVLATPSRYWYELQAGHGVWRSIASASVSTTLGLEPGWMAIGAHR